MLPALASGLVTFVVSLAFAAIVYAVARRFVPALRRAPIGLPRPRWLKSPIDELAPDPAWRQSRKECDAKSPINLAEKRST